jgi:general L-amino acid transport system permease protein
VGFEMPYVPEPGAIEPLMVDLPRERQPKLPPGKWIKKNLFNNWYNSLLTVVLGVIIVLAAVGVFRFVFVTARWAPVIDNLTLFMVGRFPRTAANDQLWRVVIQVVIWSGAIGLGWGAAVSGARFRAMQAGVEYVEDTILARVRRYWSLIALIVLFLVIAKTLGPLLLVLAALIVGTVFQMVGSRIPGQYAGITWAAVAFLGVFGYQIVSGFVGTGWIWLALPIVLAATSLIGRGDWDDQRRMHTVQAVVAVAVFALGLIVYSVTDLEGVGWDDWEGFHLNLIAAAVAITLSFPLGLLLALARRSSFPALRTMATVYIELIRGVPLISLLLMAQFFIGFFINTTTPLSLITRALAAMTLFTAAYVAEIVRGGLQAVPGGQVEAGNSIGLSPWKVTRLIVLPQALRAVIPAMVGQFISLFKDTSLLFIIGVGEILRVRELVHGQPEFRGFGITETLVFVMLAFWAVSFAMSRESQRLERKLGVGER